MVSTPRLLESYMALLATGRQQAIALEAADFERFLELGEARDGFFAVLQGQEADVPTLSEATRVEIRQIIQEILSIDRGMATHLDLMADDTKDEMARLQVGLNALQSYNPSGESNAFFIDRPG